MPTYTLRNKETGDIFEESMRISVYEQYMVDNPHIERYHTPTGIVSMQGSLDSKTDSTWKEVLSKVAEAHPSSPVGERYGKKTINQIKTKELIKKHIG